MAHGEPLLQAWAEAEAGPRHNGLALKGIEPLVRCATGRSEAARVRRGAARTT